MSDTQSIQSGPTLYAVICHDQNEDEEYQVGPLHWLEADANRERDRLDKESVLSVAQLEKLAEIYRHPVECYHSVKPVPTAPVPPSIAKALSLPAP